ncbi:MAG: hypothetical protein ACM37W_08275 [Actinomycetota bacterium]
MPGGTLCDRDRTRLNGKFSIGPCHPFVTDSPMSACQLAACRDRVGLCTKL